MALSGIFTHLIAMFHRRTYSCGPSSCQDTARREQTQRLAGEHNFRVTELPGTGRKRWGCSPALCRSSNAGTWFFATIPQTGARLGKGGVQSDTSALATGRSGHELPDIAQRRPARGPRPASLGGAHADERPLPSSEWCEIHGPRAAAHYPAPRKAGHGRPRCADSGQLTPPLRSLVAADPAGREALAAALQGS